MAISTFRDFHAKEAVQFLKHVIEEKSMLISIKITLLIVAWSIERWLFPFSSWVPLVYFVWETAQCVRFQRALHLEEWKKKLKKVLLKKLLMTPFEPCDWLNKLLMEVWSSFMEPKITTQFSIIVEKHLKHQKSKLIEKIELEEFSLGSHPPSLGLQGVHWRTLGNQRFLCMGFDWDTNGMSIILNTRLAKPLSGKERIVINSLHIRGELRLMMILDGQAALYSFETTPEVRIGVAFEPDASHSLPETELTGVSIWLEKLLKDSLVHTMVEPRRRCYCFPSSNVNKKIIGGALSVTIICASSLTVNGMKSSISSEKRENHKGNNFESSSEKNDLQTFVEVELDDFKQQTDMGLGSNPKWEATFNMNMHENTGTLRFHLYEWHSGNVSGDYLTKCEIKVKCGSDDSTIFWAIGPESGVLAKQATKSGEEIEMVVPFEEVISGKLSVRLCLRECQYSDGSYTTNTAYHFNSWRSRCNTMQNLHLETGRKLKVKVIEGRNLKVHNENCDSYVKLKYGKIVATTRAISHNSNPQWNQELEFNEIEGSEYLEIKCYSTDIFGDNSIGSARINLEGTMDESPKNVCIPLEDVSTGELRLQIKVIESDDDYEQKMVGCKKQMNTTKGSRNSWIELVIVEARDLIADNLRGIIDPYVRVHCGPSIKRTKVVYKSLNPRWNQTFELPDTGNPLILRVKDQNAELPESNIGECMIEYEKLPFNQMIDKWIPLQGMKKGEIHVLITRKYSDIEKESSIHPNISFLSKVPQISNQMGVTIRRLQNLVDDGDLEALTLKLKQIEAMNGVREDYISQLEREKTLLLNKISELDLEMSRNGLSICPTISGS